MTDLYSVPSQNLENYRGRILTMGHQHSLINEVLEEYYEPLRLPESHNEHTEFFGQYGDSVKIAVVNSGVPIDVAILDQLPNLEAVVNFGAGFDAHDLQSLRQRGVSLSNTPNVLNACVADTALGLYLDTMRRFSAAERFLRNGEWLDGPFPLTVRANHRTVGILGLGRIGFQIARRFEALDSKIHYWSRSDKYISGFHFHTTPLALAQAVDVLIVAIVGGAETVNLVDSSILNALGPRGVIVNIARGSVIDDDALVAALRDNTVAAAGLDVYVDEPEVDARYLELDNAVLYPHVGSATEQTREDMARNVLENLKSWIVSQSLVTPV